MVVVVSVTLTPVAMVATIPQGSVFDRQCYKSWWQYLLLQLFLLFLFSDICLVWFLLHSTRGHGLIAAQKYTRICGYVCEHVLSRYSFFSFV